MNDDVFGGIDPPADLPRYFAAINDPPLAKCKKCGVMHGMGMLNTETGIHTPMDLCKKCLWEGVKFIPPDFTKLENDPLKKLKDIFSPPDSFIKNDGPVSLRRNSPQKDVVKEKKKRFNGDEFLVSKIKFRSSDDEMGR
jgi:hypothetical protein